jgi:GT2 family glycosyltransferase
MPGGDTVSAVIVNWNTATFLMDCLRSLDRHWPAGIAREIIVVDNGSTDLSAELVRSRWPSIRLITNSSNLGYQRANNQGMQVACGDFLLLINPDARLTEGCLAALLARFDADPSAAVVAPRLAYADGSFHRWTAGRAPGLMSLACHFLFLDRVSAAAARRSLYLAHDVDDAFRPEWVSSACMLVSAEALAEVGPMDERYFLYMDDVDLCQRFRDADWHVWYEPAAVAVHHQSAASGSVSHGINPAAIQNLNDYVTRQRGTLQGVLARLIEFVGFTARAVLFAIASLVDRRHRPRALAHLRNARSSLRRGYV